MTIISLCQQTIAEMQADFPDKTSALVGAIHDAYVRFPTSEETLHENEPHLGNMHRLKREAFLLGKLRKTQGKPVYVSQVPFGVQLGGILNLVPSINSDDQGPYLLVSDIIYSDDGPVGFEAVEVDKQQRDKIIKIWEDYML